MARKLKNSAAATPPSAPGADDPSNDLNVLHPDVTVEIAGRKVTVREYGFVTGLEARVKGKPLTDALTARIESGDAKDSDVEDYLDLLAQHATLVRALMQDSIEGSDADWLAHLDEVDGNTLLMLWWGICGRFFVRLAMRKAIERLQRQVRAKSAGPMSSTSSPLPVTAAPSISNDATPSVS